MDGEGGEGVGVAGYGAAGWIVEAGEQRDDCGFPGAGGTDDADELAGGDC